MKTKYGFEFSEANYNGLSMFESKFAEHEKVIEYILSDAGLTVAARNIFKSPKNAAYPFLLSVRAGKRKKDGDTGTGNEGNGDNGGNDGQGGTGDGGGSGDNGGGDSGDGGVSEPIQDVVVEVKQNPPTSGVVGGTWADKPDVESFGEHSFLAVVIASHIVIEKYGVVDYLIKKDRHCIVRETLQTLYHATKYLDGFELFYNRRVVRVLLAGKWYNVGLLTRMDTETNTTVFVIQHGRRYAAMTPEMFTSFIKDYATGIKIGNSSVKLEDMSNAKKVMVSMVSNLEPDLTEKIKRTF